MTFVVSADSLCNLQKKKKRVKQSQNMLYKYFNRLMRKNATFDVKWSGSVFPLS